MKDEELRAACELKLTLGLERIQLTMPGRFRGEYKRLFGRRGPFGRVIGEVSPGRVMVDFRAADVLRALDGERGSR